MVVISINRPYWLALLLPKVDLIKKEPIDVREVLTNSSEQINGVMGSIGSIPGLEVHTCISHKSLRDDDTKKKGTLMVTFS